MGGLILEKKTLRAHSQIWYVLYIRDGRLLIRLGRSYIAGMEERIDLPAQVPAGGHQCGSCGLNGKKTCSRIGVGIGRALEKQCGAHENQGNRKELKKSSTAHRRLQDAMT